MLTLEKAEAIQNTALSKANEKSQEIAVAIVDSYGELIVFSRMNNVSPHAAKLANNKAYTSARDRQTTKNLAQWANATNKDLSYWADPRFTGIAGGVPIESNGLVIGAIGISGLSEEQDHDLATDAIRLTTETK